MLLAGLGLFMGVDLLFWGICMNWECSTAGHNGTLGGGCVVSPEPRRTKAVLPLYRVSLEGKGEQGQEGTEI